MKRLTTSFTLIVFMLYIIPGVLYSQWEKSTGINGGELTEMVCLDSVLFAISPDLGIFSKEISGQWQLSYNNNVDNLIQAGNCIIACQGYMNPPVRSFNYGNTWEPVYSLDGIYNILSIDTVLFYGPHFSHRSYDFGDSYHPVEQPESPLEYESHSTCDDSLFYTWYHDDEGLFYKLYYSADCGDTWDTICKDGLFSNPYGQIEKIRYMNGTFWSRARYFSASSTEIYVFDSPNNEWINVTNNLPMAPHNQMYEYNGDVYCTLDNHPVYKFNYTDSTWLEFTDHSKNVNQLIDYNDQLYCAADQGAYSIDDNGLFTAYNEGFNHRNISSIDELNGEIYVAANNEIFKSIDSGVSFEILENAYGSQIIATDSVIYTLSSHDFRRSWDGGNTWHTSSNWLRCPNGSSLKNMSITNNYCFVGTDMGLYRSVHGTLNWNRLENGPFYPEFIVENLEAIGRTVIAGEYWFSQQLYLSRTHGSTFNIFDEFSYIDKVDQALYILKDTIIWSDDLGVTWNQLVNSPQNNIGYCIDTKGDTIIVGGRDIYGNPTILMNNNPSDDWIDIVDNLPIITNIPGDNIDELKIIDGVIFTSNPSNGLWYRNDILTTVNNSQGFQKEDFVSVFPNPASKSICFSYELPYSTEVQISLFDHFGNTIDIVRLHQACGYNQLIWNVQEIPAGVYYYILNAGSNIDSGKVIIVN